MVMMMKVMKMPSLLLEPSSDRQLASAVNCMQPLSLCHCVRLKKLKVVERCPPQEGAEESEQTGESERYVCKT